MIRGDTCTHDGEHSNYTRLRKKKKPNQILNAQRDGGRQKFARYKRSSGNRGGAHNDDATVILRGRRAAVVRKRV
jgi:hypothetical protein